MVSHPATKYVYIPSLPQIPSTYLLENGASVLVHGVVLNSTTGGNNAFIEYFEGNGTTEIAFIYVGIVGLDPTTIQSGPYLADKGFAIGVNSGQTAEATIFYSDVGC